MRNKRVRIIAGLAIAVIAVVIAMNTFTQSGVSGLKGGFTEVAKYRNENNTGPIQHIFVVTVKDTAEAQLEDYGNFMPHHKYGNTKVYFFVKGTPVPKILQPGNVNFDPKFNSGCFALYEKSAMGNFSVSRQPFRSP